MYPVFKRILDFVISLAALAMLWPILLLLGLLVRLTSPGPALFAQVRSGRGLKPFRIYKFRTMYTTAPSDTPTHQLSGAQNYITPLGAFLRKTSLDELPQLWNILRGDMALVGQIRGQRPAPRSHRLGPDQRPGRIAHSGKGGPGRGIRPPHEPEIRPEVHPGHLFGGAPGQGRKGGPVACAGY